MARACEAEPLGARAVMSGPRGVRASGGGEPRRVSGRGANIAGVWDVRGVPRDSISIVCPSGTSVWTVPQNGCTVSICSDSSCPASDAGGYARDGRVRAAEDTGSIGLLDLVPA